MLPLLVISACNPKTYGERQYAAKPFDDITQKQFTYTANPLEKDDFDKLRNADARVDRMKDYEFAVKLKNSSDLICNEYKIDLALTQTGDNFIADALTVGLGALGGGIGGGTAQATSAAVGAITGLKSTISSDIFQKVTDIVSNYIDASRDDEWTVIEKRLKSKTGYHNKSEIFNDLLNYHDKCSLIQALATAQRESADKKAKAEENAGTETTTKPVVPKVAVNKANKAWSHSAR